MRQFEGGELQKQLFGKGSAPRADWGELRELGKLLKALLRSKYLIATAALLGALGGFLFAGTQGERFVSSAQVMIDTRVGQQRVLPTAEAVLPVTVTALESELDVLRSLDLVERVIDSLGLDKDPEFVESLRKQDKDSPVAAAIERVRGLIDRNRPGDGTSPAAAPDDEAALERHRLIQNVAKRRSVRQVSTMSAVFEISFSSEDRTKAAVIANAFADRYLEMQVAMKQDMLNRAEEWLSRRQSEINDRIAAISLQLDEHTRTAPFSSEAGLSEAQALRDSVAQRLDAARSRGATGEVERLSESYAGLNRRLAEQSAFDAERSRIEEQLRVTETTYSEVVSQLMELNQQSDILRPDATTISLARPAFERSQPKPVQMTILGGLGASALVAFIVLGREIAQRRLRSLAEIEEATELPVLGFLARSPRKISPLRTIPRGLPTDEGLQRATRKLKASLAALPTPQKVIAGASALQGEGKSSTILLLAYAYAEANEKVLLLDLDFWRSPYRSMADVEQPDLDELVSRPDDIDAFLVDLPVGIELLPARAYIPTAATLVGSSAFERFMDAMRARYDRILIDMPPVLPAVDFARTLSIADAVVMMVAWNATPGGAVASSLRILRDVGVQPVGIIATMVNRESAPGYADDSFAYASQRYHSGYY